MSGWKCQSLMPKAKNGIYAIRSTTDYGCTSYVVLRNGKVYEWGAKDGYNVIPVKDFAIPDEAHMFCDVVVSKETHPIDDVTSREGHLVEVAQTMRNGSEQKTTYLVFEGNLVPWKLPDGWTDLEPADIESIDGSPVVFRDVNPNDTDSLPTANMVKTNAAFVPAGDWQDIATFPKTEGVVYETKTILHGEDRDFETFSTLVSVADGWVYGVRTDSNFYERYTAFVRPSTPAFRNLFRVMKAE